MKNHLIIGSRGSELALWQAHFVQDRLREKGITSEVRIIKTQGDKIQHLSFDKIEGKGFFTKELEDALLANEIDLAVHSHKDLPTTHPEGLTVAAVSYREDPSELLLLRREAVDEKQKLEFKKNAVIGTSSARRKTQLRMFRPDVTIKDIRGNVPTRVEKLRSGDFDGILLAAAGVERLGLDLSDLYVIKIDPTEFIPAPAQGVLALQTREFDTDTIQAVQTIHDADVEREIAIERKVLNLFDGGCQLPLGVYCRKVENEESTFSIWAAKADNSDETPVCIYLETKRDDAPEIMVRKLTQYKPASVFITRNVSQSDLFYRMLSEKGYTVNGYALIDIKMIPVKEVPETDWIFFSSKHAVKYFLRQHKPKQNTKYAAVGKGTAEELRKFGYKPDFIGYSTDTRLTGKQFAATVKNEKVLFPQAKGSLRTIQKQFSDQSQVANVIVYESIDRGEERVPDSEVIFFTSPSNVEAFFKKNSVRPDQKVIAMGHATTSSLEKYNIKKPRQVDSFSETAMARTVFSLYYDENKAPQA